MKQRSNIFFPFFFLAISSGVFVSQSASCQDSKKQQQQEQQTGEKNYTLQKTRQGNNGLTSELWVHKNDTSKYIIKKYRNKNLINISHYERGLPNGYLMMANDNGVIQLEGNMKDGRRDGTFKSYDDKGKLLNTIVYRYDTLVNKQ